MLNRSFFFNFFFVCFLCLMPSAETAAQGECPHCNQLLVDGVCSNPDCGAFTLCLHCMNRLVEGSCSNPDCEACPTCQHCKQSLTNGLCCNPSCDTCPICNKLLEEGVCTDDNCQAQITRLARQISQNSRQNMFVEINSGNDIPIGLTTPCTPCTPLTPGSFKLKLIDSITNWMFSSSSSEDHSQQTCSDYIEGVCSEFSESHVPISQNNDVSLWYYNLGNVYGALQAPQASSVPEHLIANGEAHNSGDHLNSPSYENQQIADNSIQQHIADLHHQLTSEGHVLLAIQLENEHTANSEEVSGAACFIPTNPTSLLLSLTAVTNPDGNQLIQILTPKQQQAYFLKPEQLSAIIQRLFYIKGVREMSIMNIVQDIQQPY